MHEGSCSHQQDLSKWRSTYSLLPPFPVYSSIFEPTKTSCTVAQRLQKAQINKLSSSLSRERAEAAELGELAEMMGLPTPRSRAASRPGSPGRAFRSPYKSPSRPASARSAVPCHC